MSRLRAICIAVVCVELSLLSGCGKGTARPTGDSQSGGQCKGGGFSSDCVVTFYDGQGQKYISRQFQSICPSAGTLSILADEPGGQKQWQLTAGGFSMAAQAAVSSGLSTAWCSRQLAESIFFAMAAGGGYIEQASQAGEPVRFEGQRYRLIDIKSAGRAKMKITLYSQIDSGRIDLVTIEDVEKSITYMARSYNFLSFDNTGRFLPRKVDILKIKTESGKTSVDKILELQYTNIRRI